MLQKLRIPEKSVKFDAFYDFLRLFGYTLLVGITTICVYEMFVDETSMLKSVWLQRFLILLPLLYASTLATYPRYSLKLKQRKRPSVS